MTVYIVCLFCSFGALYSN